MPWRRPRCSRRCSPTTRTRLYERRNGVSPRTGDDADAIAALHADSWRRNYRGSYSDEFLDGDVFSNRRTVWTERLTPLRPDTCTIVVEADGELIGFAHSVFDSDPTWGALLDNLHVTHQRKRSGIGAAAHGHDRPGHARATTRAASVPLGVGAQHGRAGVLRGRGGEPVGRELRTSPAGDRIVALRYAWADPSVLLID